MKNSVITFQKAKDQQKKIAMLTAYDYLTAKLLDESGVDSILVGDSLGSVMLGYDSTLPVTMEEIIHHGKAVVRGAKTAMVIIDMPFMSYQTSAYDAVVNAGRIIKETGASAVKLEGGANVCPQIKAIVNSSIPVMAHLGLTPQSINMFDGYRVQGKDAKTAQKLLDDAKAVEEAGAFALVLECMPSKLAKLITETIKIPTIGIGAGSFCDGQVLVYQDMLGINQSTTPKFVKKYAEIGEQMKKAFESYKKEVQEGVFPSVEFEYYVADEIIEKLY